MIPRVLESRLREMAGWFPVVSVTGPRQSGKSTLVKSAFPDYAYVNLEDPQIRREALEDPVGFVRNRPGRLIIDEAQHAPELFSMVQVASDEAAETGRYVLTGSQNFLLLKRISQSLAGRTGILKLLPLSYAEALAADAALSPEGFMLSGGYPRVHATGMPPSVFFGSYVDTYVERDVAGYLDVRNLASFRAFLRLCALGAGSLVNYAGLARDAGVDARTAKSWLSMLESSYVAFALPPYHANEGKRLTKSPKIYFYDTGLLCHLLGIKSESELLLGPHLGPVFENLVVAERLKARLNRGEEPRLMFYRDANGAEVDLIDLTDASAPLAVEVKSGQTYRDSFARHLGRVGDALGIPPEGRAVVARVESGFRARGAAVIAARDWLQSL